MTLIAQTIHQNVPCLIGDILFTSEVDYSDIHIPTSLGNVQPFINTLTAKPVEYWQKLYILKDNLCVSVAGNFSEIREFIKEMRIQCSYYDKITPENLSSMLNNYNKTNLSESALLVTLVVDGDNSQSFYTLNLQFPEGEIVWKKSSSDIFEEIISCGTGA
ncbi:MAG: hypothetical protein J7527_13065, partial [Chitinophagaceae bacterium]|nr:hypothetical protein [Chitinophagaceae bacterium]